MKRNGAISFDSSFNSLAGIMSGPDALFTFSFCSSFKTPSVVTWMSGMVGDGSPSGCGISDLSSSVNCDWYCLLNMLALSTGSLRSFPWSLKGATPELSF